MKYIVKFFVVTFLLLVSTHASADKIVYLDMKFVLNNSKAGKGAQDYLQKAFKDNQDKFAEREKNLKKEENDLLGQKTILSKEEYQKKTDSLRKKVIDYQSQRRAAFDKITKQRSDARNKLIETLDPILNSYIEENNVTAVIDKKFILGGQTDFDITNIIVEKLNKELPSLNLK